MHRTIALAAVAALATTAVMTGTAAAKDKITGTATLPDIGLAAFQNAQLPGSITDDNGVKLGGIGSDLWRDGRDGPGEYWMITDRGPNDKIDGNRTFVVPQFDPAIVHVRASGATLSVLQAIPLRTTAGAPVTGLPNVPGYDETPYDVTGKKKLADNPDGLDPEGLARAADGTFWVAEEYAPSLVHVSATGTVLDRYVPAGWQGSGAGYPVHKTLPGILLKRHSNHGFESLALDGDTLYTAVQTPLDNPDSDAGKKSRNARIFAFDITTGKVTAEYVHRFEKVCDVDPKSDCDKDQDNLTDSAMSALGGGKLLLEQHTDNTARLYTADLHSATNILGTAWDDPATSPSLEQLDKLGKINPVATAPSVDLGRLGLPGKIEGIAMVDKNTVAVANDNDFGVAGSTDPSRVWTVGIGG